MNRRRFLTTLAGAGVGSVIAFKSLGRLPAGETPRATLVRDAQSLSQGHCDPLRVQWLLERLIRNHYNSADPVEVFRRLFSPRDRIGIKVNCLSGRRMSTHTELVDAIVKLLLQADVPPQNILIWDRLNADLRNAGFTISTAGNNVLCTGCDALGYESELTVHRSIGSLLTKAVTTLCTAQINVPVLKDHGIVGVTLGMKNFFGAIHNPNKYHPNCGDPYVADLYSLAEIGGSVRLTIVDALEVQCEGGPPYQPDWCQDYGGLMTANDPIALDRIGWKLIEEMRYNRGLPTLAEQKREPTYIHTAAKLKLGVAELSQITFDQLD
ncbi:MAG: DUF362 domain-containing protein [bacterium]